MGNSKNLRNSITIEKENVKYIYDKNTRFGELPSISLMMGIYSKSDTIISILSMNMSSDFLFSFSNFYKIRKNEIVIPISKTNKLYNVFSNFIGENSSIIIDDDDTSERLEKYIVFYKTHNGILIRAINKTQKNINVDIEMEDYWSFSIKNIFFDLRSKVDKDGLDTKQRLIILFSDLEKALNN